MKRLSLIQTTFYSSRFWGQIRAMMTRSWNLHEALFEENFQINKSLNNWGTVRFFTWEILKKMSRGFEISFIMMSKALLVTWWSFSTHFLKFLLNHEHLKINFSKISTGWTINYHKCVHHVETARTILIRSWASAIILIIYFSLQVINTQIVFFTLSYWTSNHLHRIILHRKTYLLNENCFLLFSISLFANTYYLNPILFKSWNLFWFKFI